MLQLILKPCFSFFFLALDGLIKITLSYYFFCKKLFLQKVTKVLFKKANIYFEKYKHISYLKKLSKKIYLLCELFDKICYFVFILQLK